MLDKIKHFLLNIFVSLTLIYVSFAALELTWLGFLAADWYKEEMAGLLRSSFITWPWLIFYLIYGFVTFVLAIVPNRDKPWYYAAIDGSLLGLASYGTYNLTNYSILQGYSIQVMLVDWTWGIFLTSLSASAGWVGFTYFQKDPF